jgi:hypothetical protein
LPELLPRYESTLQNLQLVQDLAEPFRSRRRSPEELSKAAICALDFAKKIKLLQISGVLYLSETSSLILGEGHTELEAVMLNYVEPAWNEDPKVCSGSTPLFFFRRLRIAC